MIDFEVVTGLSQETVEQMARDRERLTVVCAWCLEPMGTKDGGGTVGISHGICEGCATDMLCEDPS